MMWPRARGDCGARALCVSSVVAGRAHSGCVIARRAQLNVSIQFGTRLIKMQKQLNILYYLIVLMYYNGIKIKICLKKKEKKKLPAAFERLVRFFGAKSQNWDFWTLICGLHCYVNRIKFI